MIIILIKVTGIANKKCCNTQYKMGPYPGSFYSETTCSDEGKEIIISEKLKKNRDRKQLDGQFECHSQKIASSS